MSLLWRLSRYQDIRQNGRLKEVAAQFVRFTARNDAGAFFQRVGDMLLDFRHGFFINQRPDSDVGLQAVADRELIYRLVEFSAKRS